VKVNLQNASITYDLNTRILVFVALFLVSLTNYYLSLLIPASHLLNFWCLGWLFIGSIYLFQDKKFQWLFFPYLFGIIGGIIPCFFIELYEYYLIEINVHAILIGATARASSLCTIFLISTHICAQILEASIKWNLRGIKEFSKTEFKYFKFILTISVCYLLLSMILTGPPLFTDLPRFNYLHDQALPGFRFFYVLIPFLTLLLATSYINKNLSKTSFYFWLIVLISIPILTNEKFSLFIDIFFYLTLPFICNKLIIINKKFIILFIIFIFLLLGFVFLKYYQRAEEFDYILTRISLQGQMIYGLDMISPISVALDNNNILNSFFGLSYDAKNKGMYHLMSQLASIEVVNELIEYKQTFTMPFPSNFSYFFGKVMAPFALILYSIPVGYSIFIFRKAIVSKNLLYIFVSATYFHYLLMATMMGKTERLIHPITFGSLILITIILIISSENYEGKKLK
jgi:hypothetical protein